MYMLENDICNQRTNLFFSALTDLISGTLVMPFNIEYNYYNHHWLSSKLMCYIWMLSDIVAQTASIWSLVVIAIDRWMVKILPF